MSHRPREDEGQEDEPQDSEGRSGRPISRHRGVTERIVDALRVIESEPDPKRVRRKLARGRIEGALRDVVDLDQTLL